MSVHPSPVAVTTTPVTDDECHTRRPFGVGAEGDHNTVL
jgi:hypothetical protein